MVSQVVVRPDGGDTSLRIEPVPGLLTAGSHALHFGSQDLIRLAGFAATAGMQIARFFLADAFWSPLEAEDEASVSEAMIEVLTDFDARELQSAMSEEFDGIFATGVELISPLSGVRIVIRRRGFVDTSAVDEAEHFLESAWRALQLT